jgi:hypothetical protein
MGKVTLKALASFAIRLKSAAAAATLPDLSEILYWKAHSGGAKFQSLSALGFPLNRMSVSNDLKGLDHGIQMIGRDPMAAKDLRRHRHRALVNEAFQRKVCFARRILEKGLGVRADFESDSYVSERHDDRAI